MSPTLALRILLITLAASFSDVRCSPTSGKSRDLIPDCAKVAEMRTLLLALFDEEDTLIPAAARLGFHSCVDGCHGCVDLTSNFNFGLERVIERLTELHRPFYPYVSRADFFAFAAQTAVQKGVIISNDARTDGKSCPFPCFPLRWGRDDVDSCSGLEFPVTVLTHNEMMSYFERKFNFRPYDVVALMGAHTLGGAKKSSSGHSGYWTKGEKTWFDEKYYANMVDRSIEWKNVDNSLSNSDGSLSSKDGYGGTWQFNGTLNGQEKSFMLNTDFEVLYDLQVDPTGRTTCTFNHMCGVDGTCQPENCQPAYSFDQARNYAQDCPAFMRDFLSVFDRLLKNGYNDDQLFTEDCPCFEL